MQAQVTPVVLMRLAAGAAGPGGEAQPRAARQRRLRHLVAAQHRLQLPLQVVADVLPIQSLSGRHASPSGRKRWYCRSVSGPSTTRKRYCRSQALLPAPGALAILHRQPVGDVLLDADRDAEVLGNDLLQPFRMLRAAAVQPRLMQARGPRQRVAGLQTLGQADRRAQPGGIAVRGRPEVQQQPVMEDVEEARQRRIAALVLALPRVFGEVQRHRPLRPPAGRRSARPSAAPTCSRGSGWPARPGRSPAPAPGPAAPPPASDAAPGQARRIRAKSLDAAQQREEIMGPGRDSTSSKSARSASSPVLIALIAHPRSRRRCVAANA
ncbi:hypothetical protein Ddc_21094 [Ditylenchus destructor]|nr:hypothetical protein Ddc_21094 [Ditylenchus destructor]